MPVHHFNTFPLCHTDIKQNLKQARRGGKQKLCQGEANLGSRKAQFIVVSGEGKACGEHGSPGRGRRNIKLGSNEATLPVQEEAKREKGFQEYWAQATGMRFKTQ